MQEHYDMADGQVAYVGASAGSLLVVLAVLLPPLLGWKPLAFRRQFRLPIDHMFCGSAEATPHLQIPVLGVT